MKPAKLSSTRMPEKLTLLTLDTALNGCSAGIFPGNAEAGYYEDVAMTRGQAEALWPMIERVKAQSGIAYDAIDAIAVTCGPGNFTGLRIALAAARTFCRMQAIPAYGLSTTHCIAFEYHQNQRPDTGKGHDIVVALDTKRGDYYTQRFSADCEALEPPTIRNAAAIYELLQDNKDAVLTGYGLDKVLADMPESLGEHLAHAQNDMRPAPATMATMCFEKHVHTGTVDALNPLYMRDAETNSLKHTK